MRRVLNHDSMFAVGYFASLSVTAGATLSFHASSLCARPAVSITALDRNEASAVCAVTQLADLGIQQATAGSWLELDIGAQKAPWQLEFQLELYSLAERCVIGTEAFGLFITAEGNLCLRHAGTEAVGPQVPLLQWVRLCLVGTAQRVVASVTLPFQGVCSFELAGPFAAVGKVVLGSDNRASTPGINAKIAHIRYADETGESRWDFPFQPTLAIPDSSGARCALRVNGAPTFAVTGPHWDGTVHDPRLAPDHYAAVHLHEDDQPPFDWPASYLLEVAADATPGVYGLTLSHGALAETFPFVVRAAAPAAKIVFLLPTFTYQAYANEALPEALFPWLAEDRGHRFAQDNGWLSLYDRHQDGSGVSWASSPKPWVTVRPDYIYPLCGGPHGFPLDLHALRFFARGGAQVDVITDHDLDREGYAALAGYQALFTGSHPEYWTRPMHEALHTHLEAGGSLAYLGGNGFYWATAASSRGIEVRRGVTGTRTWEGRPGEGHVSLTGEAGGLWRWRGKPEHRLTGIGSTGMGFTHALPYKRRPASYSAELAWLFRGVQSDHIDAPGLLLGGPAGYEIDRVSDKWGTPAQTKLLAEAGPFLDGYVWEDGELYDPAERHALVAHMTLRNTPAGGIVFAVGSVCWLGALPSSQGQNDVGVIMGNLVAYFDPGVGPPADGVEAC
ncbi:N,N-dimethylformamidase beta subunit family domain-containing protein [Pseudomonas typographi]|uniref:N,N-dimethylformamidase beta subunit-like C-terminal domain-containing protein n=1 Tax=Pseudomonas typographi TaxID=2715964 RepID=A0ABR7Z3A6_9PSED|nr:N,N-dimethylformamidase beta subunit family domain-containing protein [Pseudomonas typographi]MBD1550210.1 hypothetical protein [Pseudomonas typographi]MBD1586030.1 hypothetical protein [Pseudomonas typographi]MBD1599888.1 hypothetical protein [Pseudomonas typographi]